MPGGMGAHVAWANQTLLAVSREAHVCPEGERKERDEWRKKVIRGAIEGGVVCYKLWCRLLHALFSFVGSLFPSSPSYLQNLSRSSKITFNRYCPSLLFTGSDTYFHHAQTTSISADVQLLLARQPGLSALFTMP